MRFTDYQLRVSAFAPKAEIVSVRSGAAISRRSSYVFSRRLRRHWIYGTVLSQTILTSAKTNDAILRLAAMDGIGDIVRPSIWQNILAIIERRIGPKVSQGKVCPAMQEKTQEYG